MPLKCLLVRLALLAALCLAARADPSCQRSPNLTCILKLFFKANASLRCLKRTARNMQQFNNVFDRKMRLCMESRYMQLALDIVRLNADIKNISGIVQDVCNDHASIVCASQIIEAYLSLRQALFRMLYMAKKNKLVVDLCPSETLHKNIHHFRQTGIQLDGCIFKEPERKKTKSHVKKRKKDSDRKYTNK